MHAVKNQIICLQEDGSVGGVPRSFFEDFGASQAGLQDTGMLCWMTADRISWHWVRSCAISQLAGSTPEQCGRHQGYFGGSEEKKKKSDSNPFAFLSFFKSPSSPSFSTLSGTPQAPAHEGLSSTNFPDGNGRVTDCTRSHAYKTSSLRGPDTALIRTPNP